MQRFVQLTAIAQALALSSIPSGCGPSASTQTPDCETWPGEPPGLGAHFDPSGCQLSVRTFSSSATRIEVWLYASSVGEPLIKRVLERDGDVHSTRVTTAELLDAGIDDAVHYGFRAWGPNWPHDRAWSVGEAAGLREDVDAAGNRFNPNKLLTDPYGREQSHDPGQDLRPFVTGADHRHINSGVDGPKSIALRPGEPMVWERPAHPRSADVIYEVHVRGLTKNDDSVPEALRGTYAGAALKAKYLRELGVTAIELLPLHETNNGFNGEVDGMAGANYWGYASLSFFAPERRYSSDASPGGPTREVIEMVRAFHAEGIKVYVDVVYNHSAETGVWDSDGRVAPLLSWRGLDNAAYYQLGAAGHEFRNDNGVGPNLAFAHAPVQDMVIESLRYWHEELGVDGFRFDLATILGNTCESVCFRFDAGGESLLARIGTELPTADLIAEPWSATDYQLGEFLAPWAEWNDAYRDTLRRHINKEGVEPVPLADIVARLSGSSDRFADDGRKPMHSINFLVAHDGFTLADLFSCNGKQNDQDWPFGPSPGGSDNNISWDQGGDPRAQRQAARTALALLFISSGVPMVTGGDEFLRSQRCNNNMFNLDNEANWLDWQQAETTEPAAFTQFFKDLTALRRAHSIISSADHWTSSQARWLTDQGALADSTYLGDTSRRFIGLALDGGTGDGASGTLYVGYNGATVAVTAQLPDPPPAMSWMLIVDTQADAEPANSGLSEPLGASKDVAPRSLIIAVAR